VLSNPALSGVSEQVVNASETSANFVTTAQVQASAEAAGFSAAETDALVIEYADAQVAALKASFAGISLFALLALYYVRHLPTKNEEEGARVS
jgi:membrane protein required for beta-lactamase induction